MLLYVKCRFYILEHAIRFDFDITNICLGDAQQIAENVTCEDQREALDSALSAIGGLGKINSLLLVSYMIESWAWVAQNILNDPQ